MRYAEAAERCLKLFFPAMQQESDQFSSLCSALDTYLHPASILVLCGEEKETAAWRAAVSEKYRPELTVIAVQGNEANLPPPLCKPPASTTTAWLCRGTQCLPPITHLDELLAELA